MLSKHAHLLSHCERSCTLIALTKTHLLSRCERSCALNALTKTHMLSHSERSCALNALKTRTLTVTLRAKLYQYCRIQPNNNEENKKKRLFRATKINDYSGTIGSETKTNRRVTLYKVENTMVQAFMK